MEYVWNTCGIRVEMCRICVEYVWNMCGIRVEYVWNMCGICVEYAWNYCLLSCFTTRHMAEANNTFTCHKVQAYLKYFQFTLFPIAQQSFGGCFLVDSWCPWDLRIYLLDTYLTLSRCIKILTSPQHI